MRHAEETANVRLDFMSGMELMCAGTGMSHPQLSRRPQSGGLDSAINQGNTLSLELAHWSRETHQSDLNLRKVSK